MAASFNRFTRRGTAAAVVRELDAGRLFANPIVTEIAPAARFWPAEVGHQEYFARNGGQPYCALVVAPKVAKFRKHFVDRLKQAGS